MKNKALALALTAIAAAGVTFGVAQAREEKAKAERVVYVCDSSDLTRRSFEREFGPQVFVTAEDALKAAREQEVWTSPRCMTRAEFAKFEAAANPREPAIILSSRDR